MAMFKLLALYRVCDPQQHLPLHVVRPEPAEEELEGCCRFIAQKQMRTMRHILNKCELFHGVSSNE